MCHYFFQIFLQKLNKEWHQNALRMFKNSKIFPKKGWPPPRRPFQVICQDDSWKYLVPPAKKSFYAYDDCWDTISCQTYHTILRISDHPPPHLRPLAPLRTILIWIVPILHNTHPWLIQILLWGGCQIEGVFAIVGIMYCADGNYSEGSCRVTTQ